MGIEDAKQKRALPLNYRGPEVDKIFDTLVETGEHKDYKKAVEKLTVHFNPQVNTTYEVYNFRKAQQNERARTRAKTGESADTDKEIQEQIVLSSKSNALRRKALREDLDLTARLLKAGRALEPSETQGKEVESDKTTVNVVKDKKKSETCSKKGNGCRREQHSESRSRSHIESRKSNEASKCRNCGGAYTHKDSYPARNKNAPPVASLIILLKFVGQFHRIH